MRGEGKRQGRRPLWGGEGADGEAARCGSRRCSGVRRRLAKGRRREGCGGGPSQPGGQCPGGREVGGWVREKGGSPREEEGEVGWPKAKAQADGLKIGDGPKLKKESLFEF
jgi:hypothetical protein